MCFLSLNENLINNLQLVTFCAIYIFQIAIKIAKYRFALTLMNKQMDNEKLSVCNKKKQNLLHILASTARPHNNWELQKKVMLENILW